MLTKRMWLTTSTPGAEAKLMIDLVRRTAVRQRVSLPPARAPVVTR